MPQSRENFSLPNKHPKQKLAALEEKYDPQFKVICDVLRQFIEPPQKIV